MGARGVAGRQRSNGASLAAMGDAIAAIWQASAMPDRWVEAMRAMNALMPECRGLLIYTPFARGPGMIWRTIDEPAGFLEEYVARWQDRDVTLHAITARMPADRLLFSLHDLVPESQIDRCEIWQQLYVPHGIRDMDGIVVNGGAGGGGDAVLFGAFCARGVEIERRARRKIFAALAPHLEGAAALHWRLVRAESSAMTTRSALDRLSLGVIVLDTSARVIEVNRAARRLLDGKAGIGIQRGYLVVESPALERQLESAIAEALNGGAERPLALARPSASPLSLVVTPAATISGIGDARVLLFLSDPDLVPANAGERMAALYGLTRSEAVVAQRLAEGLELDAIAQERGTSINTIRTQLKSLMAKIGAARQSDVVRSVLAMSVLERREL